MNAAILAVGSELLGPSRLDTNSLKITSLLERHGVSVVKKTVIGDDREEIAAELRRTLDLAEVVLITGGLGPTEDDCTREAVADACSLTLEPDPGLLVSIRRRFEERGMEMAEVNARQAWVFNGQRTLENPRGTAPGFHIALPHPAGPRHIWIFPGVPWELQGMLDSDLAPWLGSVFPSAEGVFRRTIKITGMTESAVEERLAPFYENHPGEPLTVLSSNSEIQIHLRAEGKPDDAFSILTSLESELRGIFGERIYGVDDDDLESVVGRMLVARTATIATAESCTGGLLGSRITDVSGSSAYYLGGLVVYSRDAKEHRLGIASDLLDEFGQVSEETSRAMAANVRELFGSTYGIGITGIAGPTGGTKEKPVGTIHVAVASADIARHRQFVLPPPRQRIKHLTTQIALDLLRVVILKEKAAEKQNRQ